MAHHLLGFPLLEALFMGHSGLWLTSSAGHRFKVEQHLRMQLMGPSFAGDMHLTKVLAGY